MTYTFQITIFHKSSKRSCKIPCLYSNDCVCFPNSHVKPNSYNLIDKYIQIQLRVGMLPQNKHNLVYAEKESKQLSLVGRRLVCQYSIKTL